MRIKVLPSVGLVQIFVVFPVIAFRLASKILDVSQL
jgi:hypothetical protein